MSDFSSILNNTIDDEISDEFYSYINQYGTMELELSSISIDEDGDDSSYEIDDKNLQEKRLK